MSEPRVVFISHSSTDAWVARQIAKAIIDCGATPFLDNIEVQAGEDFDEVIRENLNKAHELVVLWTPWAIESKWIWAEVGAAWARGIPIIGLLYGVTSTEILEQPSFPVFLKSKDWLSMNEFEKYAIQLKARCEQGGGT
jgi:hypothetical protein